MKSFALRLLASHPLAILSAIALLPPLTVLFWNLALSVDKPTQAVHQEAEFTRAWLGEQLTYLRSDLFTEVRLARVDLFSRTEVEFAGWRRDTFAELGAFRADATGQIAAVLPRVDRTLTLAEDLSTSIKPVLSGLTETEAKFGVLADTYSALPAKVETEVSPAWLSLKPEITCRDLQGNGYGGCMRGRINGMLGEAVNVGGVFTKQFPAFTASVNGILSDAHLWTDKYVVPHPLTTKQKFGAAGKIFLGLGTAGLRGGVF